MYFSVNPPLQSFTCPIVNITSKCELDLKDFVEVKCCLVDGGWSSWSTWFICEQETGEKCQCRTRTCTQPEPQFDGKLCQGNHIEINRCEGKTQNVIFAGVILNIL